MPKQRQDLQATEELLHAAEVELVERQILRLAMERTGHPNGAIFLREPDDDVLRMEFHVVKGIEVTMPGVRLHKRRRGRPNGIAWHVVDTNEPYLTNDTSNDPYYARYFLEVRSIAAAPIPYQGRAIGVITVSATERDGYCPADLAELEALAASSAKHLRRAQLYRHEKKAGRSPILIKGLSPQWQRVEQLIERVSPSNAPVLIRGESGTGKELVARSVHFNSLRASGPFVSINCAALSEPLLESTLFGHVRGAFTGAYNDKRGEFAKADGGTLFLDELGELTPALQAKVLRAIELGEIQPLGSNDPPEHVDVRVIAATNRDLDSMRRLGQFRDDLFYRVAVVTMWVPPLRSYIDTLEVLCQVFIARANQAYQRNIEGLAPEALALLRAHDFPGNMRELRNIIDHGVLVTTGDTIDREDLPLAQTSAGRTAPSVIPEALTRPTLVELRKGWIAQHEGPYLAELLEETGGNVVAAADLLGVDRTTVYRLLKKHALKLEKKVAGR